jgi:DNA-binding MarR family transcriptional regulator
MLRGTIVNELLVASRYALELTDEALRAAGVDPAVYGPVSFIGMLQPVTRTRLAEATGQRRTTQRDVLRRLIDDGFVREAPNPRDGRSTLPELTAKGQRVFDRGIPVFQRVLREIDVALEGSLDEHEAVARRIRVALQTLVTDDVSIPA